MQYNGRQALAWESGASLSSFTWFGPEAPNAISLPAGMDGVSLVFVGAENAAGTGAEDLLDPVDASKVAIAVPAGGGRLVWAPDCLRAQGWIALRSETVAGAPQNQGAARAATWLWPSASVRS